MGHYFGKLEHLGESYREFSTKVTFIPEQLAHERIEIPLEETQKI